MHPEFLIPGLEDQHEEPFVGCLFCCQPFRWNYSRIKNVDSKFDLFCQAFHLTEDSFKAGLRMSPLCPNCLGLIQRIGKMLKRIQELETKLNLEKEAVINLLREEYGTLSSPEGQHPQNFSPVQFRGDIQKRLNVVPVCVIKEECPGSVGSLLEADSDLNSPPATPNSCHDEGIEDDDLGNNPSDSFDLSLFEDGSVDLDLSPVAAKEKEIRTRTETGGAGSGYSVEISDPEEVEEETVKVEPIIKYCLPAGVVLKDCSIRLDPVENSLRKRGRGRPRKVGKGEAKPRKEAKELKKIKTKMTKKKKISESQDSDGKKEGNRRKIITDPASGSPALELNGDGSEEKRRTGGRKIRRRKRKERVKGCRCADAAEGKCSMTFSPEDPNYLKLKRAHYKEIYLRRIAFCVECNLALKTKKQLQKHRIQVHGERYPIYCPEEGCGEGLLNARLLREHMYIHTGDYPYRCDQCNTGYPDLFRLNDHKFTHVTTMDFVCEICGKAFKSPKILRQHYMAHSEDRPFKCEHCDLAFKLPKALKAHLHNKHSEEKPFLCQDCGKAYKWKEGLQYHIGSKHGGPKPNKVRSREKKKKYSNSESHLNSSPEETEEVVEHGQST